jgi:hypothetical protein
VSEANFDNALKPLKMQVACFHGFFVEFFFVRARVQALGVKSFKRQFILSPSFINESSGVDLIRMTVVGVVKTMIKSFKSRHSITTALLSIIIMPAVFNSESTWSSISAAGRVRPVIMIIAEDMALPHEGPPHGVPSSYDWATKPRLELGNNPGSFKAITAWGQLYEDAKGNPATNTRVQIRYIRTYVMSKSGQWRLLQAAKKVVGAAFVEDFSDDANKPADIRNEPDGSISVTAGGGYNFHFWPQGRATINPQDIGGVFTMVQARLIVDDPMLPDDRNKARYLLSMGADYWKDLTAQWQADWSANGGVGLGRFKYVRKNWQGFGMTTLSWQQLEMNPPPI